jgi:hypothetical protein
MMKYRIEIYKQMISKPIKFRVFKTSLLSFVLLFSLLVPDFRVFSQNPYSFRVLANKGQNTFKSGSIESQPLRTGSKLSDGDEIMVAEGGYVGLVHAGGKTVELKTAGTYTVQSLSEKVKGSAASLASKYADFILTQMTKENDEDVNKNSRVNNKVSGAVERAVSPIHVLAPGTTYLHGPVAIVRWEAPQDSKDLVVMVKNLSDDIILSQDAEGDNFKLNAVDPKINSEKLIILEVKSKSNNKLYSNGVGIKKLPAKELEKINRDFKELQAETSDDTPLNKIIIATFYEQNNLLLDAITNYELAISLAPDVSDFKTAYDLFLTRNNIK